VESGGRPRNRRVQRLQSARRARRTRKSALRPDVEDARFPLAAISARFTSPELTMLRRPRRPTIRRGNRFAHARAWRGALVSIPPWPPARGNASRSQPPAGTTPVCARRPDYRARRHSPRRTWQNANERGAQPHEPEWRDGRERVESKARVLRCQLRAAGFLSALPARCQPRPALPIPAPCLRLVSHRHLGACPKSSQARIPAAADVGMIATSNAAPRAGLCRFPRARRPVLTALPALLYPNLPLDLSMR